MRASDKPSPPTTRGEHTFLLRPATPADISAILAIERADHSAAHWTETAYHEVFARESPARIAILVEDESHSPRGFVIARLVGGECELENIAVMQNLKRHGAGIQLMRSLMTAAQGQNAHSIFLEVRESNIAARALYEKCGFAITGRRPKYYSDPQQQQEDAVLYSIQL